MKISARIDGSIYGATRVPSSVSSSASQALRNHGWTSRSSCGLVPLVTPRHYGTPTTSSITPKRASIGAPGPSPSTITSWARDIRPSPSSISRVASRDLRSQRRQHTAPEPPMGSQFFNADPPVDSHRDRMLSFVDSYDDVTVEEHLEYIRDPYMRKYAQPERPNLRVAAHPHDYAFPSPEEVEVGDEDEQFIVKRLHDAVQERMKASQSVDLDTIYDLYQALPQPPLAYLTAQLRHSLLNVLGKTKRNGKSMLRYFAVVADIKNSGLSLSREEWNTALSFAGGYVSKISENEVEAVLHLWREMEHEAKTRASEVTFNILFDVASKAGKYGLAEMIYQEMLTRGFHFNRFHHVSLIHFFGLKMNAQGVRSAYREMVEHGEIIDSLVLNAVIAGFLRCGEEAAADHVYQKMKSSDERSKLIPHRDYGFNMMITRVLVKFGQINKRRQSFTSSFQSAAIISPDLATYRILLNHFGVRLGHMPKVAQLLDEMKFFRVPLHGSIFLALFKGFSIHGGVEGSAWSPQRLANVWEAFLSAYDKDTEGLYISGWLGLWMLRAFARCTKSREQVLTVYDALKDRWDPAAGIDTFMLESLHNLLIKENLGERTAATWNAVSPPASHDPMTITSVGDQALPPPLHELGTTVTAAWDQASPPVHHGSTTTATGSWDRAPLPAIYGSSSETTATTSRAQASPPALYGPKATTTGSWDQAPLPPLYGSPSGTKSIPKRKAFAQGGTG